MALTVESGYVTTRTKAELHELLGQTTAWYDNAVNERAMIDIDEIRSIAEEDDEQEDLLDQLDELLQNDGRFTNDPVDVYNINYIEIYV